MFLFPLTLFLSLLPAPLAAGTTTQNTTKHHSVLILGGGVAGVIAARSLAQEGIHDFLIVEAHPELGGRLHSTTFGVTGRQKTVELGANWVQGTQTGQGVTNPIWELTKKHSVQTVSNDWNNITTYDSTGQVDYLDLFDSSADGYSALTVGAGIRVDKRLADLTGRVGYSLTGWKPKDDSRAQASEYYQFDWEYAQTPEQSSWIASSWGNNFTYTPESGGFGGDNLLSVDQRGFKTFIQKEAATFLQPNQVTYNSTVTKVKYSNKGVTVTLQGGRQLTADYALVTFSLGVLQNDDVKFNPAFPDWKQEAIDSMVMATYTKIFLQFDSNFWFKTQMGLYADEERGRYPVWQSLDHVGFFPDSGIVFVTVTGDYSIRIEKLPDAQVQEEVMGVLRAMFPKVTIPDPKAFYFYRWHSDPLFRGSYSNWPPSFYSQHHDNLRASLDDRLWFSGEALSQKYFGFLHGAYYEGEAAGKDLAKCIKGGGCVENVVHPVVSACFPYEI